MLKQDTDRIHAFLGSIIRSSGLVQAVRRCLHSAGQSLTAGEISAQTRLPEGQVMQAIAELQRQRAVYAPNSQGNKRSPLRWTPLWRPRVAWERDTKDSSATAS